MSLLVFGNQNYRIFKNIHWLGNFKSIIGLYQLTSRCSYNPDFFDYKVTVPTIKEVSTYKSHDLTFVDLMDNRIVEILNLSKEHNKQIMIMYSGGLDSTGICVSALKNLNSQDKERITILMTPRSYFEFPAFFSILSKNFRIQYCSNSLEIYSKDNFIVTGMQGDLFFGSNGWIERALDIDPNLPKENYQSGMLKLFESLYPSNGKLIYDRYFPIVEESLIPINTVSEYIWWFYFTQSYQPVYYAYLRYKNSFTAETSFKFLFNFYDSPNFEYWALNNVGLTIPYDHKSFKYPLKQYIIEYSKNYEYRGKKKFPSYGEVVEANKFNYGVTENWDFLSFKSSLTYFRDI